MILDRDTAKMVTGLGVGPRYHTELSSKAYKNRTHSIVNNVANDLGIFNAEFHGLDKQIGGPELFESHLQSTSCLHHTRNRLCSLDNLSKTVSGF